MLTPGSGPRGAEGIAAAQPRPEPGRLSGRRRGARPLGAPPLTRTATVAEAPQVPYRNLRRRPPGVPPTRTASGSQGPRAQGATASQGEAVGWRAARSARPGPAARAGTGCAVNLNLNPARGAGLRGRPRPRPRQGTLTAGVWNPPSSPKQAEGGPGGAAGPGSGARPSPRDLAQVTEYALAFRRPRTKTRPGLSVGDAGPPPTGEGGAPPAWAHRCRRARTVSSRRSAWGLLCRPPADRERRCRPAGDEDTPRIVLEDAEAPTEEGGAPPALGIAMPRSSRAVPSRRRPAGRRRTERRSPAGGRA